METSRWGSTSFVLVGLEAGWCGVVAVLLSMMHSGSFWSFNQSFMVLTMPVIGLLSIIGLLCGLAGSFATATNRTTSAIGASINALVLVVVILLAL